LKNVNSTLPLFRNAVSVKVELNSLMELKLFGSEEENGVNLDANY